MIIWFGQKKNIELGIKLPVDESIIKKIISSVENLKK